MTHTLERVLMHGCGHAPQSDANTVGTINRKYFPKVHTTVTLGYLLVTVPVPLIHQLLRQSPLGKVNTVFIHPRASTIQSQSNQTSKSHGLSYCESD